MLDRLGSENQPLTIFNAAAAPARRKAEIARYREELEAALGKLHGAVGRVAIGAGNFLGFLRGGDDAIDLAVDVFRHRVDLLAVGQRDRKIGRPEEDAVDARRRHNRIEVLERGARLDHGERDDVVVGFAQIDRLVGQPGERRRAVRPPTALADRREFCRCGECARVGLRY